MKVLIVLCCTFVALVSSVDRDNFFIKIGSYSGRNAVGVKYSKHYYIPKTYRVNWFAARALCQTFKMELARLETQEEHDAVRELSNNYKDMFSGWPAIDGGFPKGFTKFANKVDWYFEDDSKINYTMEWVPGTPDHIQTKCLALGRDHDWKFNDVECSGPRRESFICQEVTSL